MSVTPAGASAQEVPEETRVLDEWLERLIAIGREQNRNGYDAMPALREYVRANPILAGQLAAGASEATPAAETHEQTQRDGHQPTGGDSATSGAGSHGDAAAAPAVEPDQAAGAPAAARETVDVEAEAVFVRREMIYRGHSRHAADDAAELFRNPRPKEPADG